jgi:phosphate starvation-inducible protein PhoH and related proteins
MLNHLSSLVTDHIIPLPLLTKIQFANFCGIMHENIQFLESFFNIRIEVSPQQLVLKKFNLNQLPTFQVILKQLIGLTNHPISLPLIQSLLEPSKPMNSSVTLMHKHIIARNEK